MKKYILLAIIFIAIFAVSKSKAVVFCEEATATTCVACPDVSQIIYEIYKSHEYPFYFISLVADKNDEAYDRVNEYNIYGYPTAFFDGGYEVVFGKQDKQDYINAIEQCLQRERANIEATLNVRWNGNGINVDLLLKNKENEGYEGYLKVYVVEPTSRWKDYDGNPYHFGFLGYAINKEIYIEAGGELKEQSIWNASNEGYEVSKDNIMAIAVVFNKASSTGYSDPPYNRRQFSAHYVDVCVASSPPADEPPLLQFIKKPSAVEGYRNVSFKWSGEDDFGDVLFSYMLKGYEEEWHDWSEETNISYYNLPDGDYEFLLRGKDNVGQISQIEWAFTIDTSPPKVIDTYPKADARNIPVYVSIKIKFSHEMNKSSVENGISISPTIDYTIQWKDGNEVIIKPSSLQYETMYTISIKNALRISGQKMNDYSFSFETSSADTEAPKILYTEPFAEELYGDIKIKFSEPMDNVLHNAIIINPWVPYIYRWEDNDTLLLIKLKEYLPGNYTVEITKFMEDKAGNPIEKNYTFYFFITLPHVVYTNINNGDKNVPVHTKVKIKFSHEMNKSSVENGISIHPECKYYVSWDGNILVITPELKKGTKYFVNISKDAKDIRNISLSKEFSLSFTTEKEMERDEEETNQTPSFTLPLLIVSMLILLLRRKRLK